MDKTPLNRCNSLFRFPYKSILQPLWVRTAQDTRIYDWDLHKSVTHNEWEKALCAGSMAPTSLLLASYLFSKHIVLMLPEAECPGVQGWPKESQNRAGTISSSREKSLTVPSFHLEYEIFPAGLVQAAPSGTHPCSSLAGEDLVFCLTHRSLLNLGPPQSDKSLHWHLPVLSIFPKSVGLLWPAATFLPPKWSGPISQYL